MSEQFLIPLKFSYQQKNANHVIPEIPVETQFSKHDDGSVWIKNLGESLIESVSMSIGGGKGYWCPKCNKLYREKPCVGYKCKNMYTSYVLNKEKLSRLISELGNIDDTCIRQYVESSIMTPAIEQIFREEVQCQTIEEAQMGIVYENLMELINERYSDRVYDKIVEECCNNNFMYGEKPGTIIDEHSSEYLSLWNKLKK